MSSANFVNGLLRPFAGFGCRFASIHADISAVQTLASSGIATSFSRAIASANDTCAGLGGLEPVSPVGFQDILVAVVDGLKGFPEAINATFPETVVQTCIVHLLRHSMNFASWKDRKHVARALKAVYRAGDAEAGLAALAEFEAGPWGEKYPAIAQSWRRNWDHVIPFFAFPEAVRRMIYTTNAIESLNAKIRRAVRTRGHFPSDDAATKLLYLVLNHAAQAWKRPPREWTEAKTQFAIIFGERFVNV